MSELLEVEIIVRDLKKKIIGRKIKSVWLNFPKLIKRVKMRGWSAYFCSKCQVLENKM